jgi:serine/threonine protein phosphatase PrpC
MVGAIHGGGSATDAHVRVSGQTDVGRERSNNEDGFLVAHAYGIRSFDAGPVACRDETPLLLAVSDGMGGEAAGEVASALALESLRTSVAHLLLSTTPDVALRAAFEYANRSVIDAAETSARAGMGATLTAALVTSPYVHVSTVGDSRAYLLRAGRLVRLTRDQSYAQMLIDRGELRPDEVEAFPLRNVILQAIGRAPALSIIVGRLELRRGDRLLLCSDGLSGELKDEEIAAILAQDCAPDSVCEALIAAANARGGHDNITVVTAAFDGPRLAMPSADDPVVGTLVDVSPR